MRLSTGIYLRWGKVAGRCWAARSWIDNAGHTVGARQAGKRGLRFSANWHLAVGEVDAKWSGILPRSRHVGRAEEKKLSFVRPQH